VSVAAGVVTAIVVAGLITVSRPGMTLLAQQPRRGVAGTYVGRYLCGRPLGMQLTLEPAGPGRVSGVFTVFSYGGTAANPIGAYRVAGTFDPQTRALRLQPGDWIKQPPQWSAVGLSGTVSPDTTAIKGTIESAICTSFDVFREGAIPEGERIAQDAAAQRARGFDPERLRAIEERTQREQERAAAPASASRVAVAPLRHPKSSVITKVFETERGPSTTPSGMRPLDTTGYRRGDMIGPIYDGRFEFATAAGLDNIRYFAQAVGDIARRCTNLDLEAAKFQVLPYVAAGAKDLIHRIGAGKATDSENFQSFWLMMLQLNSHWKCQYDPGGLTTRDQAQARCDAASSAASEFAVFPSLDAATDITLFLGRYGCESRETRHLVRQLIEFARLAHTRLQFTAAMPSPTSPEGRAYARMFENCARQQADNAMDGWCGCYVRTVHGLNPPAAVLEDLSNNPFLDGSTYMQWVAANLKGGGAVYDCSRQHSTVASRTAQRTTACLVSQTTAADGGRSCTYRAAWGEFTRAAAVCEPEINSRVWGYREVDCTAGARAVGPKASPRIWNDGSYHYIDYESPVADTFVPDLPATARERVTTTVRFMTRKSPGTLREMQVTGVSFGTIPVDPRKLELVDADMMAVAQEDARVLTCSYNAEKGLQWVDRYWFEKIPTHVSAGRLSKAVSPHPFTQIKGVATKCPAGRAAR
jgi:hypothetical protein